MIKTITKMNNVGVMSLVVHTRLGSQGVLAWERDKLCKGARISLSKQDVGVVRTG
jgi:hypothetical protein